MVGSLAIIAMSNRLTAAALAGAAAVDQHPENTVRDYQAAVQRTHDIALSGQSLGREVERTRRSFEDLAAQEQSGELSGTAGRGAVFRVLTQKTEELRGLEEQIAAQQPLIEDTFQEGNDILSWMRELTVAAGPVDHRSVRFSEESVRLAGVISGLNQYNVAPIVVRAAEDLQASVVLPERDGRNASVRDAQSATITSVLDALDQRSRTLQRAAEEVMDMEPSLETA